ncbi:PLP-dependent aminotransferase family protein [Clostridium autoethanogenum]|jgi:2-aminoadipate transaminase|uniref:PLP-dependent aminotransferase family protein n=1 Tax=Clostridium autoethanogenum DSM 10061 TaxID=1341692 RepID=A0ABM5NSC7_9CLOT|nr:PLP-dependent aminotransferase family protein [Clostridium autoethanogenum]AGY75162.1 PLP-dependent aminotransferase family protein [Clostridium autoethanogenum DSM 10061]ALU35334.1 Transcriptional regulator GntR family with aminotransferase domain-containing protein [Clostridium autoethanogenum DSM 10061]OVY49587.1 2-aminoadipate transaminase [Clostridium autoethanogenum]
MEIKINRKSKIALYIQIENQIKNMIYSKILPKNYILPSERQLANTLKVNRSTIIKAYEELKEKGLIDSNARRGTYISFYDNHEENDHKKYLFWDEIYSKSSNNNFDNTITKIMNTDINSKMISFGGGMPSPDLFPQLEFQKIQIDLLKNEAKNMFFQSPVSGNKDLKNEIKKLMLNREVRISTSDIIVTSGSQQGLDLVVRTFVNYNDVILVENPTFFGAIQLLQTLGAKIISIPMDKCGMRVDVLEYLINEFNPKFIYTIPNFQNPTGITMSLERRYDLIKISEKYGIPIIEDDPYGELRYEGNYLPPLKALDKSGYVIYLSTFSKVISLGLRVGWIAAPERVIAKLSLFKQLTDLHVNTLSQHIVCEFLRQGYYKKHVKKIRKSYSLKRDLMSEKLTSNIRSIKFFKPEGGFYIWCKLPDNICLKSLLKRSLKNGVNYVTGDSFYIKKDEKGNFIRLNFTYPKNEEIIKGIKLLQLSISEII